MAWESEQLGRELLGCVGEASLEDYPDDKARDTGNLNTTTQSSGSLASWTGIGTQHKVNIVATSLGCS